MTIDPQPESQAGQTPRARTTVVPSEDRLSLMDVWRVLMKRSFIILTTECCTERRITGSNR